MEHPIQNQEAPRPNILKVGGNTPSHIGFFYPCFSLDSPRCYQNIRLFSTEFQSASFDIIVVTIPEGVKAGQAIHVQAPDGRLNEVIVPDGFGPGDVFTVEFSSAPVAEKVAETEIAVVNEAQNDNNFASALDVPSPTYSSSNNNYPSAHATPIYSAPPQYPSAQQL